MESLKLAAGWSLHWSCLGKKSLCFR